MPIDIKNFEGIGYPGGYGPVILPLRGPITRPPNFTITRSEIKMGGASGTSLFEIIGGQIHIFNGWVGSECYFTKIWSQTIEDLISQHDKTSWKNTWNFKTVLDKSLDEGIILKRRTSLSQHIFADLVCCTIGNKDGKTFSDEILTLDFSNPSTTDFIQILSVIKINFSIFINIRNGELKTPAKEALKSLRGTSFGAKISKLTYL